MLIITSGWSLGNVQDRYIFGGPGADQLVGRAVCGLPTTQNSFAILPPHFSTEILTGITDSGWENILPGQ